MATYTHEEVATVPALEWIELTAFISSIAPTQVVLTNSDGTLTVLTGTGFAGTLGTAGPPSTLGSLTAGDIIEARRTDAAQTVTYERLSGFTLTGGDFTVAAQLGGLQGVAASILNFDDTLNGYSGRDFFKGFAGNDTMNGGGELDTVRYSGPFHSGPINVSLSATSTVTGNASVGVDTLNSVEHVIGSNSNQGDVFVATGAFSGSFGTFNMFEGRGGNDSITGNGNTRLSFNEATAGVVVDMVAGTAVGDASVGSDTFSGVNSILGSQLGDDVTGNGLDNTLIGQGGDDTLRGAGGNDTINGGEGNDVLIGGGGNDSLVGGPGEDIFRGLAGNDIFVGSGGAPNRDTADYSFDAANGGTLGIRVNQDDAIVQGGINPDTAIDGFGDTDTISAIVNIIGTQFGDQVYGGAANNRLQLNAGDDYAFGGLGNDTLLGGTGVDTLEGGEGDDVYFIDTYLDQIIEAPGGGDDIVFANNDYIMHAEVERATINAAGEFDILGNDLANAIVGNAQANGLAGLGGNDTIEGGDGVDTIDGGSGNDQMIGGNGTDFYFVDSVADVVVEIEIGILDVVYSSAASFTLPVNVEVFIALTGAGAVNAVGNEQTNFMVGNESGNNLAGLGGTDVIFGGAGNDTINGGTSDAAGYDLIFGGAGADELTSGGGHDYFVYEFITDGGDTITDFATNAGVEDDILDFRPMFFPTFTNTGGITTVSQAVASGHLTFTQSGANVQVFADADGGGNNNVLMATLLNQTAASVQNYTLI